MKKRVNLFISALVAATTLLSAFAPAFWQRSSIQANAEFATDWKGNDAYWTDTVEEPNPADYAYSFIVVGDTQYVTMYDDRVRGNPKKYSDEQVRLGLFSSTNELKKDNLKTMYKWIADNAETKKIKCVMGVGDITHTDGAGEWKVAHEAISQLNGVVPYTLVRGNHDNRKTFFDYYYSGIAPDTSNAYMDQVVDCYEGYGESYRARNTAHVFSGGNVDYLVVCLDFGAEDEVLEWANRVVEAHPNHTVIVTTHAYQSRTGPRLDGSQNDSPSVYNPTYITDYSYPADTVFNDGSDMWNKFLRKHKNISMVFSGHVINTRLVYEEAIGDHGNVVQQIMINAQSIDDDDKLPTEVFYGTPIQKSLTGMVAIFYCNEDGTMADVQWYSTLKNKWYAGKNNENILSDVRMHTVARNDEAHVQVRMNGEGTVTPAYQVLNGEPVTLSVTAGEYYNFKKLMYNGQNITDLLTKNGDTYSYTLNETTGRHYFVADFVDEKRYTLLEENDLWKGRIAYTSSGANATYEEGDEITFSVLPNAGYTVKTVLYNGEELTAENGVYKIVIKAWENTLKVVYDELSLEPSSPSTPEPPTPNKPSDEQTDDKGCNSSLSVKVCGIVTLSVLSLILTKRRKKDGLI